MAGAAASLVLAMVLIPQPAVTTAAWTDGEHATATLAAGRIDPPTDVACRDGSLTSTARISWKAPATNIVPDGYVVEISQRGVLVPGGTTTFPVPPGQMYFDLSPSLSLLGEYTVRIFSTLGDTWVSGPSVWVVDVNVSVLGIGITSCERRLLDIL